MDLHKTLSINLSKYGIDGIVIMGRPTFRKRNALNNEIGAMVKPTSDGCSNVEEFKCAHAGDLQIISTLMYVISAPFKTTLEGFLEFCDKLDAVNLDYADELFREMQEHVKKIESGDLSPFADSTGSETGNSE